MPDTCWSGDGVYGLMLSMGLDDPEIAAYANTTFNMPTYAMNASLDIEEMEDAQTMTWSWGPDTPYSTMAYRPTELHTVESMLRTRVYFANGSAVSYINLDMDAQIPVTDGIAVTGRLEPPMVLAEKGMHEWTGRGTAATTPEIEGTVVEFADWECTPKGSTTDDEAAVRRIADLWAG